MSSKKFYRNVMRAKDLIQSQIVFSRSIIELNSVVHCLRMELFVFKVPTIIQGSTVAMVKMLECDICHNTYNRKITANYPDECETRTLISCNLIVRPILPCAKKLIAKRKQTQTSQRKTEQSSLLRFH